MTHLISYVTHLFTTEVKNDSFDWFDDTNWKLNSMLWGEKIYWYNIDSKDELQLLSECGEV